MGLIGAMRSAESDGGDPLYRLYSRHRLGSMRFSCETGREGTALSHRGGLSLESLLVGNSVKESERSPLAQRVPPSGCSRHHSVPKGPVVRLSGDQDVMWR